MGKLLLELLGQSGNLKGGVIGKGRIQFYKIVQGIGLIKYSLFKNYEHSNIYRK